MSSLMTYKHTMNSLITYEHTMITIAWWVCQRSMKATTHHEHIDNLQAHNENVDL
jgi:Na+-transporting NADH:ubiquinone oxidoreductase subunit NqrF